MDSVTSLNSSWKSFLIKRKLVSVNHNQLLEFFIIKSEMKFVSHLRTNFTLNQTTSMKQTKVKSFQFSMNVKLQVLFLSLAILWCLMADIEAQQSNARPKGEEVSSGVAESDILAAQMDNRLEPSGRRESRKFKLFDIWNKPKTSPLFLINGTVCRFVNSNPICTNLSTTGLFPANSPGNNVRPASDSIFNNPFGGQNQNQNQNPNQNQQQDQNFNQNQNQQNQNTNQQNRNQPNQRPNG